MSVLSGAGHCGQMFRFVRFVRQGENVTKNSMLSPPPCVASEQV